MCSCARSRGSASCSSSQFHTAAEEILLLHCEPQALGTSGRAAMLSLHLLHCREPPPGYTALQKEREVGSMCREHNQSTASTCVKPSKKLEGDKSLLGAVEQFHCIYHLLRGNLWVWLVGVVSDLDEGGVFSGECTRILMTLKSFLRPCPTNFTPFSSR